MRDVDVGRGKEDVDARILGVADCLPALIDVVGHGAAEGGDLRPADLAGDAIDGVEVGWRGGGEAGLDAVDAHALEQLGDLQLLLGGEGDAGGLFAVAQGGIKDSDSVSHNGKLQWSEQGLNGCVDVAAIAHQHDVGGGRRSGHEHSAGNSPRFSSSKHTLLHAEYYRGRS